MYDVSNGKVRPVQNTYVAMDLIKVNDPVVMNCLIDECKLETILFTDVESLPAKLTADEQNVPNNLFKIVLTNPYTDFYPAPNYRSYSNHKQNAQYLQVNIAQRKA